MRTCSKCGRDLDKMLWDLNSGNVVCPRCSNIIIRGTRFRKMSKFERKLNFVDTEIISRYIKDGEIV